MANQIRFKRASGSDPSASDLAIGEPGLRTDTAELFFKKDDGTVAKVSGGGGADFKYLELRNAANNGAASYPGNDFTMVIAGTTTATSVGAANALLVSVSGVIQKPNSGTSTSGITGFIVDGSRFKTATNLPAAPDFIIYQEAGGVAVPSDSSVTSAKIADGAILNADVNASAAIAGTKISPDFGSQDIVTTGNLDLSDSTGSGNNRIKLGTGDDLSIFHDGTDGFIAHSTGKLRLNADTIYLKDKDNGDMFIQCNHDAGVQLRYDNSAKLETKSFGVQVTGELYSDGLRVGDGEIIRLGDGEDLQILHSSGQNIIQNTVANTNIKIQGVNSEGGTPVIQLNPRRDQVGLSVKANQGVELYYDSSKKLHTDSNGVTISGRLLLGDSSGANDDRIRLGADGDLSLYHDGSDSYIVNDTGALYIKADVNRHGIQLNNNGKVALFYQGTEKFRTYADGVHLDAGTLRGDDNAKILLGSGSGGDLRLTHDGSDSYIQAYGAGSLELQAQVANEHVIVRAPSGGDFRAYVNGGSTLALICNASGQNVEMRHGGSKKAETVSGGFTVTGTCTATSFAGDGSNLTNLPSSGLATTGGTLTGTLNARSIIPTANNTYNLGSTSSRWANVYINDLDLSNEGKSNDVDGTWGSYTIQEGAESLFLINRRNGKKYKFNLTEVS
tara:strand:- start:713 stop:2728 length:2016 start_codon:yes stop_codon:yes gene_type:complete